jgi:hypothetical protein
MKQCLPVILLLVLFSAFSGFPVTVSKESFINDKKIEISGSASITEGQYRAGHHYTTRTDSVTTGGSFHDEPFPAPLWIHGAQLDLKLEAQPMEKFKVIVHPVFEIWYDQYPVEDITNHSLFPYREHWNVDIAQGEGIYNFGNNEKPYLSLEAGIFPFKYNADAVNLGEYLFRSGCYPPFITTSFDYPYATLAGLRIHSTLFGNLQQDLLLTTETKVQPLYDWSLSYLINFAVPSLLDIGAGVNFNRIFSVADEVTTPSTVAGKPNPTDQYIDSKGDTLYYSFKGIKLMAKVGIDPKGLLPSGARSIFGKEDGKIYAEAAVLGLKNINSYKYYSPDGTTEALLPDTSTNYYNDVKKRIPIMFGLNVPAFKLLDLCAIQGEWYGWDFKNALYYQTTGGQNAIPGPAAGRSYTADAYKNDNWKWSLNLKKTFMGHFSVIAQFSRDHTRTVSYYEKYKDENEMFTKGNEWGWWLKLKYGF